MNLEQVSCSRRFRIAVSLAAVLFSSCERNEQNGLMERIDALESELTTRDEKIQQLHAELKSLEKEQSEQQPDLDLAKASYKAATEDMTRALRDLFKDQARIEDVIINDVSMNDPEFPIVSAMDVVYTTKSGNWRVKLPMRATTKGRWETMEEATLIEVLKSSRQIGGPQQVSAQPAQQNQPTQSTKPALPRDVMGAGKTEVIDWGDPKSAPSPQQQTQQPAAPQVAPQKPALPPKVMPTNRDVMIDFGD